MITPALDLQAVPQLSDGARTTVTQSHGTGDAGGFGAAFTASLSETPALSGDVVPGTGGGAQALSKQLASSATSSSTTRVVTQRSLAKTVGASTHTKHAVPSQKPGLQTKNAVISDEEEPNKTLATAAQSVTSASSEEGISVKTVADRMVASGTAAKVGAPSAVKLTPANPASETTASLDVDFSGAADPASSRPKDTLLSSSATTKGVPSADKTGIDALKSNVAVHDVTQTASFNASQSAVASSAATYVASVTSIIVPTTALTATIQTATNSASQELAIGPARAELAPSIRTSTHAPQSIASANNASKQFIAAWNSVEQKTATAVSDVGSRSTNISAPLPVERPESNVVAADSHASSTGNDTKTVTAQPGLSDTRVVPEQYGFAISASTAFPLSNEAGAGASIKRSVAGEDARPVLTATISVVGNTASLTALSTGALNAAQLNNVPADVHAAVAKTETETETQGSARDSFAVHPTSTPGQTRPIFPGSRAVATPQPGDQPVSGLRYAIGAVSDGPIPIGHSGENVRSAPALPSVHAKRTLQPFCRAPSSHR